MKSLFSISRTSCVAAVLAMAAVCGSARAATPAELLAAYVAQAGTPASAQRGEKLFSTQFGRELGLTCASCHGENPARAGRNELSGKPIAPLAPSANPARLTDAKAVEHWFRQNCRDVIGRECTPAEKADVMTWLLTLKP